MSRARPNVLLMHCHDVGRFLGCYGYGHVSTPNLDRLAAQGVRFTRGFATAPQCSPSRASLFTGQYPQRHGVLGLTHADFGWDLDTRTRHVGEILAEAGYWTGLVGVHHESLRLGEAEVARRLGMSHFEPGGNAEVVAERAIARLTELADGRQPFYLQVGFFEPHRARTQDTEEQGYAGFVRGEVSPDASSGVTAFPYLDDGPATREEVAELQGAVRHMDNAAGRVLDAIERLDLASDTIVIFTTDHGLALPRAKCSLYEPGLEVAFLLRWPARSWTGGRVVDAMAPNIDVVPTLLDVLGIHADDEMDGRSFRGLLDGESYQPRDAIFGQMTYHDYYDPRRSVRTNRHKLIVNFSSAPPYMDPTQSWRPRTRAKIFAEASSNPLIEFYDLVDDPLEQANLVLDEAYADIRRTLVIRLESWIRDVDDPLLRGAVACPLHDRAIEALTFSQSGS